MVTPQEASRRRRIVYHASRSRLPDEMVNAAVKLCDREFQAIPVFSIQKFLTRLTEAVGTPPKPGELFAAMNRLRVITDLDEIGPDPVGPLPVAKVQTAVAEPSPTRGRPSEPPSRDSRIDSWPASFTALLSGLLAELQHLGPDMPAAARAGFALQLQKVDLSPAGYAELNSWADEKLCTFTNRITSADMHAGVHALYVWSCEELGPIETDRLFSAVIRDVSQYPGAAQFPPRNLL
ncbi:MAG: hypothetical protein C0467_28290 [Planctomycetaceae bacterium]|nr:hypothetical protein [Planctomycetaceae bacterium]